MDSLRVSRPVSIRLWIAAVIVTLFCEVAPVICHAAAFAKLVAVFGIIGLLPGLFVGAYFDNGGWRFLILTFSIGTAINVLLYYYLLKLFWLFQRGLRHGNPD